MGRTVSSISVFQPVNHKSASLPCWTRVRSSDDTRGERVYLLACIRSILRIYSIPSRILERLVKAIHQSCRHTGDNSPISQTLATHTSHINISKHVLRRRPRRRGRRYPTPRAQTPTSPSL